MHLIYRRLGKSPSQLKERDLYMDRLKRMAERINYDIEQAKMRKEAMTNQKER